MMPNQTMIKTIKIILIDDIGYAPFFLTAQGVNFNWAGGRSETNPDWAGEAGSTVMFWAKLSYSAEEADDGFNQPLISFCSSEYNAGLLIVGGIPFDESATPARQDPMVQLNLCLLYTSPSPRDS